MTPPKSRSATVRTHAIIATSAVIADAFLWGGAGLAPLVAILGCVIGLVRLVQGLFGERRRILTGAAVVSVYLASLFLLGVTLSAQVAAAKARAQPIIRALDAYRAANGRYPAHLTDLTPGYLPSIPRAKYTLWMDDYWFAPPLPDRNPILAFAWGSPLGGITFDLETRKWAILD